MNKTTGIQYYITNFAPTEAVSNDWGLCDIEDIIKQLRETKRKETLFWYNGRFYDLYPGTRKARKMIRRLKRKP